MKAPETSVVGVPRSFGAHDESRPDVTCAPGMPEELEKLRSIGPATAARLAQVGITGRTEPERGGPVEAFRRLRNAAPASGAVLARCRGARAGLRREVKG